ncbi:MAG: hypothetical protein C0407_03500 [Desulfobacca sp.]|nr:hypothetical protein [Desulfobacca sp.]
MTANSTKPSNRMENDRLNATGDTCNLFPSLGEREVGVLFFNFYLPYQISTGIQRKNCLKLFAVMVTIDQKSPLKGAKLSEKLFRKL